jgi:hypothetical protein
LLIHVRLLSSFSFPSGISRHANRCLVGLWLAENHSSGLREQPPRLTWIQGDIGPKFGFNMVDNGMLLLDRVRIPHINVSAMHDDERPQLADGSFRCLPVLAGWTPLLVSTASPQTKS